MTAIHPAAAVLLGIVLASASACAPGDDSASRTTPPALDNPELTELHDADQADRSGEELIDWTVVSPRDSLRRVRVNEILAAGEAVTSMDFYHAAMVFQHGNDTTAALRAYDLARTAVDLDPDNGDAKWLMAAAWDRYLMRKGVPQWYGTQYWGEPGAWHLYDIDTTAVTDSERVALGIRTLAELRAREQEMNSGN